MNKYIATIILVSPVMAATVSCSYLNLKWPSTDPDKIVTYTCENGSRLIADFNKPEKVKITFHSNRTITLDQQVMGSGFRYATASYSLTGKGNDAQWVANGRSAVRCRSAK